MKEPRIHLPWDLKAVRYMDALNTGDLEAVSALWEEASHDPELERVLAELDGAMFQEVRGNPSSLREHLGRHRRHWAVRVVAAVALAAACLLAVRAWPWRNAKTRSRALQGAGPRIWSHFDRRTSLMASPGY